MTNIFDVSKIEYSWKDKKKKIIFPKKMSEDLAYLIGVHIGDGTMNIYKREKQIDYYYELCGHEINDKLFHDEVLFPLFKKLFNIQPNPRQNSKGCIALNIRSKAFVNFMHGCVGLPLGKKDLIDIPKVILDSGLKNSLACLKGIFDTDFSLSFKKKSNQFHNYPVLELCAKSKGLVISISNILRNVEISNFISEEINKDSRLKKESKVYKVTSSGVLNLQKWFKLIGSQNPSYLSRYSIYKNFGFCPPNTNYLIRRKILLGQIDPREYYAQGET